MELDEGTARELRDWLDNREYDIEADIEDFGDLRNVFEAVLGYKARRSPAARDQE